MGPDFPLKCASILVTGYPNYKVTVNPTPLASQDVWTFLLETRVVIEIS